MIDPRPREYASEHGQRWLNFVAGKRREEWWEYEGRGFKRDEQGHWFTYQVSESRRIPTPSEKEIQITTERMRIAEESYQQAPTWDDLKNDRVLGPKLTLTTNEHGNKTGRLDRLEPEDKARLDDILSGKRKVELELSEHNSSSKEFTVLRDAEGRTRHVPVEKAEKVARRDGLTEAPGRRKASRRKAASEYSHG